MLASPTISGGFSMLESHLAPGATSGEGHLNDSSEQGGFVLEGELTLWLDDDQEPVTLGPNDSFQLPPHAQFRYANLTDKPARVLWVFN
ncbi:Cupin domain protein [compost metagenome]